MEIELLISIKHCYPHLFSVLHSCLLDQLILGNVRLQVVEWNYCDLHFYNLTFFLVGPSYTRYDHYYIELCQESLCNPITSKSDIFQVPLSVNLERFSCSHDFNASHSIHASCFMHVVAVARRFYLFPPWKKCSMHGYTSLLYVCRTADVLASVHGN